MATGIRTRQGKDLDEIFVRGAGDQILGIKANTGEDIGQIFLNANKGGPHSADVGILSAGVDIRHKLCSAIDGYTQKVVPVGGYRYEPQYWTASAATKAVPWNQNTNDGSVFGLGGTIETRPGAAPVVVIGNMWGYNGQCVKLLGIDGVADGELYKVTRLDTGRTLLLHAYEYTKLVESNQVPKNINQGGGVDFPFAQSDIGKAVYFRITKAS